MEPFISIDRTCVVAIDYDGTLWDGERLIPEAVAFVEWLTDNDTTTVLWTCREGRLLQEALDVLDTAGVHFDLVNQGNGKRPDSRKVNADLYVDDRANCGVDWNGVRKRVEEMMEKEDV